MTVAKQLSTQATRTATEMRSLKVWAKRQQEACHRASVACVDEVKHEADDVDQSEPSLLKVSASCRRNAVQKKAEHCRVAKT